MEIDLMFSEFELLTNQTTELDDEVEKKRRNEMLAELQLGLQEIVYERNESRKSSKEEI